MSQFSCCKNLAVIQVYPELMSKDADGNGPDDASGLVSSRQLLEVRGSLQGWVYLDAELFGCSHQGTNERRYQSRPSLHDIVWEEIYG